MNFLNKKQLDSTDNSIKNNKVLKNKFNHGAKRFLI